MTAQSEANSNLSLPTNYTPLELEKEIREFWIKNRIREKLELLEKTAAKGNLGYVEGPPTLNGIPHIGHARGRILRILDTDGKPCKATTCRFGLDGTAKAYP